MSHRGYEQGRNLIVERRFGGPTRPGLLDKAALELVRLKVDIIYASLGTPAALAAMRATSTIPMVFYGSADPVGLGLVTSLSRPGGNLTGSSIQALDFTSKSLELLAQASGKLTSLAYLHSADTKSLAWYPLLSEGEAAAVALGIRIQFVDVGSIGEAELALQRLRRQGVDGIALIGGGPTLHSFAPQLGALLVAYRLPSLGDPESGFLLSYNYSVAALGRAAAIYVDKILRGAKPADLPVEQVSTFELAINLKTAKALRLTIPQRLIVQATSVIE